jgi:hypothetical protein
MSGDSLALSIGRDRFPYIAQGHAIEILGMSIVSLSDAPPVPAALSARHVGLDDFPTLDVGQTDPIALVFADDAPVVERNAQARPFVLIRYAIR